MALAPGLSLPRAAVAAWPEDDDRDTAAGIDDNWLGIPPRRVRVRPAAPASSQFTAGLRVL